MTELGEGNWVTPNEVLGGEVEKSRREPRIDEMNLWGLRRSLAEGLAPRRDLPDDEDGFEEGQVLTSSPRLKPGGSPCTTPLPMTVAYHRL